MHTTISIKNFRSIRSTMVSIAPGLNVLVGSNGSGKTNLLHALKFLSNLVVYGAAVAMGRAGGPSRNFMRGQDKISFSVVSRYGTTRYKSKQTDLWFFWRIELNLAEPDKIVQISHESFKVMAEINSNGSATMEEVILFEVNRAIDGSAKTKVNIADQSIVTRKIFDAPTWMPGGHINKDELFKIIKERLNVIARNLRNFPPDASAIQKVASLHGSVTRVLQEIASIDEFNIQPAMSRLATDPLPVTRMGSDGSGVAEVILALENQQFRRLSGSYGYAGRNVLENDYIDYHNRQRIYSRNNPLDGIIENLKAGVSSIDGITTEIDPFTGRRFVVFLSSGNKFRPEEISDGTIKWLCLLVALYVPRSRVLLLEEPENFLHPWMQQRFVALAREQALKNGTTVVFSTHSATVLNSLKIPELRIVHNVEGATVVDYVADQKTVQNLLDDSDFGLGDMWVSGGIGGVTGEN